MCVYALECSCIFLRALKSVTVLDFGLHCSQNFGT